MGVIDELRNKEGTNEGAKRQRMMEGIAQRTNERPTSRDAYISNEFGARNCPVVGGLAYRMNV